MPKITQTTVTLHPDGSIEKKVVGVIIDTIECLAILDLFTSGKTDFRNVRFWLN